VYVMTSLLPHCNGVINSTFLSLAMFTKYGLGGQGWE
jgi:hypothetical protein